MGNIRRYDASKRQARAQSNRQSILDCAAALFKERGFDKTTIADVAAVAGVAIPTVYSAFGSKTGLVTELLARARVAPAYKEAVKDAQSATDPIARLRKTASVARAVYQQEQELLDLWRGAGALADELAVLVKNAEGSRRENQASTIDLLISTRALRSDLNREAARDILWALTSRDMFHLLVIQRGWTAARYERQLAAMLVSALTQASSEA